MKHFYGRIPLLNYKLAVPLFFAMVPFIANAQHQNLAYTIKRDGQKIGSMNIMETKAGDKICYKLESEIKTKFIFSITAKGIEEAVYNKGVLVYSSIYQKLNGKEKLNTQIKLTGNNYVITDKEEKKQLHNVSIAYNMVCLYTNEPLHLVQIFSDKFQKFLAIQKIAEHHYKITFPDGNFNEYIYANGICEKIEVNHSFYNVLMELHQ